MKRITFLILLLCGALCSARDFEAQVVRVLDGDTFEVISGNSTNTGKTTIRLYGIDCPEEDQPYGNEATEEVISLVLNQVVQVEIISQDWFKRSVAQVRYRTETGWKSLNAELLQRGLAWWDPRYAPSNALFSSLEAEARVQKRGFWADPAPVPPWKWRKSRSTDENLSFIFSQKPQNLSMRRKIPLFNTLQL